MSKIRFIYSPGLFMSLLLLIGFRVMYSQVPDNNEPNAADQKLAHDIFRELIEINTTSQRGSTAAAEAMATRLRSGGFTDDDIHVIGPDPQHKNLVACYRSKGKSKPVLFICHLDVVEALPSDWSVDPFTFLEKDGYYYGRGTTDIKCEDADLITNLIRLKKEGFVPNRDIIIALTADEEGGKANGVNWLLTNHRDLIEADYCINPDGGGGDLRNGKHYAMGIQTSEKVFVTFELEARNKGGHSSLPVKDNAIYRLAAALTRIANFDFPVRLNETTRKLLERAASIETGQVKTDIQTILRDPSDKAAADRIAAASAYYNAMMRTTCVATMINGGHAENALPQTAHAIINCRMLPDDNAESVLSRLKEVVADTGISVACTYTSFIAPLSPLRNDLMLSVEKITSSMWPGVTISPVMSTGATDGKYLRRAGIPVYGVSGMFGDTNDVRAHGRDERIGVKEFYEGVEFMYRLMKAIASEGN
jgi:acetylornithine deacetylase/succinyl-diaminopimelate desuccinylase-like protein